MKIAVLDAVARLIIVAGCILVGRHIRKVGHLDTTKPYKVLTSNGKVLVSLILAAISFGGYFVFDYFFSLDPELKAYQPLIGILPFLGMIFCIIAVAYALDKRLKPWLDDETGFTKMHYPEGTANGMEKDDFTQKG